MAKGCALSTGYLPRGGLLRNSVDMITGYLPRRGLLRNSVDMITDRPDMTSAVDRGRKASTQTNEQIKRIGSIATQ